MTYDIDIEECSLPTFTYSVRGTSLAGKSRDPEHDACRALIASGRPDGAVNFWRGDISRPIRAREEMMSMQARSAARMAQWTVGGDLRRRPYKTFSPERLAA